MSSSISHELCKYLNLNLKGLKEWLRSEIETLVRQWKTKSYIHLHETELEENFFSFTVQHTIGSVSASEKEKKEEKKKPSYT